MAQQPAPFGFHINRTKPKDSVRSFVARQDDDGAVVVTAGGTFGTFIDLDGTTRNETELVSKYREMTLQPEIDRAVNEITNEAIVVEEGKKTVDLVLDDIPELSAASKKKFLQEFDTITDILDFNQMSYDIFKRWLIDGRQTYHVVIDEASPGEGIKELRYIDPRKIRKVREIVKKRDPKTDAIIQQTKAEYYIYNERGIGATPKAVSQMAPTSTGLRIELDSIVQVTSGLMDPNNTMVLSYLHPAIKPLNQLRALEDSTLIYHLSRAPERRLFRVEVGNLPRMKAEQHLREMMTRYKNKLAYDASTGEIRDDRKFMTMLEDYWLPTRNGQGTEIDVLDGGTQLPQLLQSVEYFQDRLYRSLNVPMSRLKPEATYSTGMATEITRDEANFFKFVSRIRQKFSELFLRALEKQLILKGIADPQTWDQIKNRIRFRYLRDNFITEAKENELASARAQVAIALQPFVGVYFSHNWVRKNIFRQTDEEIEKLDKEIAEEAQLPQFNQQLMVPPDVFGNQQQGANNNGR